MSNNVRGYWVHEENILKELNIVIKEIGHIPSYKTLKDLGYKSLSRALQKHGGINKFRQELNIENDIKKISDYESWENIEIEFKIIIEEIGHFPKAQEIKKLKKFYLLDASTKYHGGLNEIRLRFGQEKIQKDNNYWKNKTNIFNESILIKEKYENLPSSNFLQKNGYSSFVNAVSNYYGGFNKLRSDLNEPLLQKNESGYWQDEKNILISIEKIKNSLGKYPSSSEVKDMGLISSIDKYHGGIFKFYTKHNLSTENLVKPNNYYHNWENVEKELLNIVNEIKHFPSDSELLQLKKYGLRFALRRYGGIKCVAKKLGFNYKYIISNDGHYCDSFAEKIVDDTLFKLNISHERGKTLILENRKFIPDFIINEKLIIEVLMIDINSVPRNNIEISYKEKLLLKRKLYKKHNFILFEISPSDYKNEVCYENRILELIKLINQIKGKECLYNNLNINFINSNKKPIGYWRNIDNVIKELTPLCEKLNRFPTYTEIINEIGSSVIKAIKKYHQSNQNISRVMGYQISLNIGNKSKGFWENNLNYILKEITDIEMKINKFPSASYLRDEYPSIYYAINKYHGGLDNIRNKLTTTSD